MSLWWPDQFRRTEKFISTLTTGFSFPTTSVFTTNKGTDQPKFCLLFIMNPSTLLGVSLPVKWNRRPRENHRWELYCDYPIRKIDELFLTLFCLSLRYWMNSQILVSLGHSQGQNWDYHFGFPKLLMKDHQDFQDLHNH